MGNIGKRKFLGIINFLFKNDSHIHDSSDLDVVRTIITKLYCTSKNWFQEQKLKMAQKHLILYVPSETYNFDAG